MRNLYEILGLEPDASDDDIRRAYRELSKTVHPDAHGGDRERWEELKLAYDVLSDVDKRAEYDDSGQIPQRDPEREAAFRHLFTLCGELSKSEYPRNLVEQLRVALRMDSSILEQRLMASRVYLKQIRERMCGAKALQAALIAQYERLEQQLVDRQKLYGRCFEELNEARWDSGFILRPKELSATGDTIRGLFARIPRSTKPEGL